MKRARLFAVAGTLGALGSFGVVLLLAGPVSAEAGPALREDSIAQRAFAGRGAVNAAALSDQELGEVRGMGFLSDLIAAILAAVEDPYTASVQIGGESFGSSGDSPQSVTVVRPGTEVTITQSLSPGGVFARTRTKTVSRPHARTRTRSSTSTTRVGLGRP
jgi:hypothetical protein